MASWRRAGLKISKVLRPRSFARYIAASAPSTMASASSPSWGKRLMPMLGLTTTGCPASSTGSAKAARSRPGTGHRSLDTRNVGQQQGELVAAEPGDGVLFPHAGPHPLCRLAKQLVAGGVAEPVVDAP